MGTDAVVLAVAGLILVALVAAGLAFAPKLPPDAPEADESSIIGP